MEGAKILVTGASSGIGAALARELAARGATLGLVARREDRLQEVAAACRSVGARAVSWACDLSDLEDAEDVVRKAWDQLGHIDVLVNNAAMSKRKHVLDTTPGDYAQVMDLNFHSPVRMALAALGLMQARGGGEIVMVSSTGGRIGIVHESAYCAAKAAVCLWAEAAAIDLGQIGSPVRVKLICPGPIDTEIWDVREGDLPAVFEGPFVPASVCAVGVAEAIEADGFETYVPDMTPVILGKTQDVDAFVRAMAEIARQSSVVR
ncbi:MAG: SDR family NAD(P)-dependent oxidoreductase [Acidimicrobiia bacterium]|nr:SDR family NAD(P)-dependent oxidoreductase [Acidimicrobiia bacterium]